MKKLARLFAVTTAVLLSFALVAGGATPASADVDPVAAEQEFIGHINALRASLGLNTLTLADSLTGVARDWSQQMANAGGISHRPNLADVAPSNWTKLGENVGVGGSVDSLHNAFVNSPGHYRNLVDPGFTQIAVGVVTVGGTIYVTENFMTTSGAASTSTASAPAGDIAAAAPAATTTVTKAVRVCTRGKCRTVVKKVVVKKAAKKAPARRRAHR
jgi:hypothetical protein